MIIAGRNALEAALETGQNIEKVFIKKSSATRFESLIKKLTERNIPVSLVPEEKLSRIYKGHHGGIVAKVVSFSFVSAEKMVADAFKRSKNPVFVLLDGITDTRNMGAVFRSAAAFGADGIILPAHHSASLSGETVKMSAGMFFKVPVARVNHLKDAVFLLQAEGVEIVAATEKTGHLLTEYRFRKPVGLIMGNEHKGISNALLKQADVLLKIPMEPGVDSLNVSVSTAIFLYEIYRQRK